jgi:transglutaminase-like putative cysteine protease
MKRLTFALAWLALFAVPFYSQTKKLPVVKQVKPAPARQIPSKSAQQTAQKLGITVEKYVKNYEVNADATVVETWEMQQRFDSDLVIERFRTFERAFNGDLQKAEVLEAYIVKADGRKIALAPDAVQIKPTPQAEAAPSFSSYKQIRIAYDDLEKGDATYFKIRLTTLKPYFDKQFDFLEVFPLGFGWKSIEVNLTAPADFPLSVQAVDLNGGRLADENGKARWKWRRENLKAFDIEPGMYDFFNSSPRVAASSFKNFDELGAAYWSEAVKKAVVTTEVQALADEITKDIIEPERQARAIYEWVNKNIRYLSVVLDNGGWIPHSTTEILANRYADCKDYSTILYALLKAKNIESYPVLIRSELGDWFPEVAAPDYFNHAILYIPSLKSFADATVPNTRLGLLTQQLVGKKAILAGEKTGVIETPRDNPSDNQLLSEVKIDFAPNGSLKAVSKNVYDGRSEIIYRPLFADSALAKNSGNFVKTLLAYFGVEGSGKIVRMGNPFKVGEPLTVEIEVEMPDFTTFKPKGAIRLPVAVNMLNSLELEQFVKTEKRSTNLILGATRFRENFQLKFPEGVKIVTLPPAVDFSNTVGSFRCRFALEGGGVRVTRELVISRDIISTKDYPQIRELINKSVEGSKSEIKYSANPLFAGQKSLEMRKNSVGRTKSRNITATTFGAPEENLPTAEQTAVIEAKLLTAPDDLENRRRLLRFYTNYDIEDTPVRKSNRLKHRLWILQNRPEIDDAEIYGYKTPFYAVEDAEYRTLRDEWLKQVEKDQTNPRVRLNAVEFTRDKEPEIAQKLLAEGRRLDPDNYEFPLFLSDLLYSNSEAEDDAPGNLRKRGEFLVRAFENGETALALLKKERSTERDLKRADLLLMLSKIAFELEKFDRAKALATELILDFGQDANNPNYTQATHTGNIILGRTAVRENDLAKAKEYLLIAIRAPLRREKSYFSKIDMQLAKELLDKGEKTTVSEYLKLCEKLLNSSRLYAGKVRTLKTWLEQIDQGKTPSLDFREN